MGNVSKSLPLLLVLIFLAAPLVAIQPAPARAESKTIVVPTDYSTIKEAVSNAFDGDIIYVKNGSYQENNIVVDKSVKIVGEDRDSTIITSQSSKVILLVNHSQVTFTGLTLKASNNPKPPIEVFPSSKTLTAIQIETSQYCNISGNKIINSGTAIWLQSSSKNTIESNVLWDNYYGVEISGQSTGNVIKANDVSSSQVGIRFYDRSVKENVVCANNITSCYTGLFYYFTSLNFVVGNFIAYHIDAIHFVGSTNNVLHHNNIAYNSRDLSEFSSYYDEIRVARSYNFWDDRKEGNYWSDYKGTGNNGVGTAPYPLNEFNTDNYPLLNMVNIEDYISYTSTVLPYPSATQPPTTPSPTDISSPSPSVPELSWIIIPLLFIASLLSALAYKKSTSPLPKINYNF